MDTRRPCPDGAKPVSATVVAAVVVLVVCLVYYFARAAGHRDKFASERAKEVYSASRPLFSREGAPVTYSEYKTTVPAPVDPVLFTDVRRLWNEKRLTPESVEAVL